MCPAAGGGIGRDGGSGGSVTHTCYKGGKISSHAGRSAVFKQSFFVIISGEIGKTVKARNSL